MSIQYTRVPWVSWCLAVAASGGANMKSTLLSLGTSPSSTSTLFDTWQNSLQWHVGNMISERHCYMASCATTVINVWGFRHITCVEYVYYTRICCCTCIIPVFLHMYYFGMNIPKTYMYYWEKVWTFSSGKEELILYFYTPDGLKVPPPTSHQFPISTVCKKTLTQFKTILRWHVLGPFRMSFKTSFFKR